jgi:hypothetical protein
MGNEQPCLRLNGTPRATFDTEVEAEAFSLTNANYIGDIPWRCDRCGKVHLYRPVWLLPNRIAEIRRGDEILCSPVGDQDFVNEWLRRNLSSGDEFIQIRSTEWVIQ